MPRVDEQYRFDVKLTDEEFERLKPIFEGGATEATVLTIILGRGGYSRPCPGRVVGGVHRPCIGNGSMPLELRNMGKLGKPKNEVRDQPCCRACRK